MYQFSSTQSEDEKRQLTSATGSQSHPTTQGTWAFIGDRYVFQPQENTALGTVITPSYSTHAYPAPSSDQTPWETRSAPYSQPQYGLGASTPSYLQTSPESLAISTRLSTPSHSSTPPVSVSSAPLYTSMQYEAQQPLQVSASQGYYATQTSNVTQPGYDYNVHGGSAGQVYPTSLPWPNTLQPPSRTSTEMIPSNAIRGSDVESLDPSYQFVREPRTYFKKGRVFSILWTEPAGRAASTNPGSFALTTTLYGEFVYSQIRRFVVVRPKNSFSYCLPINTYHRQGTRKTGIRPNEHAIVYPEGQSPQLLPGEEGMTKKPIKLIIENPRTRVDPSSRINFGKVYPVEHNVKVCTIGRIHPQDLTLLLGYYREENDDDGSSAVDYLSGQLAE